MDFGVSSNNSRKPWEMVDEKIYIARNQTGEGNLVQ